MKAHQNPILNIAISRVRQLLQQYEESEAIAHAVTKGALREGYLKQFLADIIATPYRVSSGFLTDCRGKDISPQIDLLVFNPTNVPGYALNDFVSVVPIEAAVLAVEVKSLLKNEHLSQLQSQQKSVRRCRFAFTTEDRKYLTTVDCIGVPTVVIAFDTNCARESLIAWFAEEIQLKAICVVGKVTLMRDPRSGNISTIDADSGHTETMQFLSLVHRQMLESGRDSQQPLKRPTPEGTRDFYPDLGAYLTFDTPYPEARDQAESE